MAAAAQAALLDELMGKYRNENPNENRRNVPEWQEEDVCKFFLCGFCPNELFTNTKADLGPCQGIHDERLRDMYKNSDKFEQMGYEKEFVRHLNNLITDVERRIRRGHARLNLNSTMANPNGMGNVEKEEHVGKLNEQIAELVSESERLGIEGSVEQAQEKLKLAEILRSEKNELDQEKDPNNTMSKELEVCDICGAFRIRDDAPQRVEEHLIGKMHIGYALIRDYIREYEEKRSKRMEEYRLDARKQRESRSSSRHRSKGQDGRKDGRSRSRDCARHSKEKEMKSNRDENSKKDRDKKDDRRSDRDRDRDKRNREEKSSRDKDRRASNHEKSNDRKDSKSHRDRSSERKSGRDRRSSRDRDKPREKERTNDKDKDKSRGHDRDRSTRDHNRKSSRDTEKERSSNKDKKDKSSRDHKDSSGNNNGKSHKSRESSSKHDKTESSPNNKVKINSDKDTFSKSNSKSSDDKIAEIVVERSELNSELPLDTQITISESEPDSLKRVHSGDDVCELNPKILKE